MLVEGKILYVDGARALVQSGRNPEHSPSVLDHNVALETHLNGIRTNEFTMQQVRYYFRMYIDINKQIHARAHAHTRDMTLNQHPNKTHSHLLRIFHRRCCKALCPAPTRNLVVGVSTPNLHNLLYPTIIEGPGVCKESD